MNLECATRVANPFAQTVTESYALPLQLNVKPIGTWAKPSSERVQGELTLNGGTIIRCGEVPLSTGTYGFVVAEKR